MCGIFGILNLDSKRISLPELTIPTKLLKHRGPDDEGYFLCNTETGESGLFSHHDSTSEVKAKFPFLENKFTANLGLGFRRLSILDLSIQGHQPMSVEDMGLTIVFNGEIYNYIEIRNELKLHGFHFTSTTDTEVILKSYLCWGESCVNKFNGMWAFAIWNNQERKLFCSRDRFGVKPFYYLFSRDQFVFASEIKSLLDFIQPEENLSTLYHYFSPGGSTDFNNQTFFNGVLQLEPSHSLTLTKEHFRVERYYAIPFDTNHHLSFEQAKIELNELFLDSVKLRQRSDVPYGYALSGGIDSSSIVCAAAKINSDVNSLSTFSMIYPGFKEDESEYIKAVVKKTGFNHHYVSPSSKDLVRDLKDFIYFQEEPFGGLSYFGEYKLRELIKNNTVTVSLEGQGADEIFTGYTSLIPFYFKDLIKTGQISKLSTEIRNFYHQFPTSLFRQLVRFFKNFNGHPKKHSSLDENYPYLLPFFGNKDIKLQFPNSFYSTGSFLNDELLRRLTQSSLPQQLIRADKNAMAFSVECRFPFLDYRIVEFANSLPYNFKIDNGISKRILRESLKGILPQTVYNRKDKIGFAIPQSFWLDDDAKKIIFENFASGFLNLPQFIDKKAFDQIYVDYSSKSLKNIDWKFWKTFSYILWYDKFIVNQSRHIK